uniref:Uncharacterized protein n=1 Tax=Haptolina ericina TaxID=156174 RepID=A0A7S3EUF3_9EUKA
MERETRIPSTHADEQFENASQRSVPIACKGGQDSPGYSGTPPTGVAIGSLKWGLQWSGVRFQCCHHDTAGACVRVWGWWRARARARGACVCVCVWWVVV